MVGNKIILPKILEQSIDLKSFVDPMQFTISILDEVNDYLLFNLSVPHEYTINTKFLRKIFTTLQETFSSSNVKKASLTHRKGSKTNPQV
jgi:hypothetical protein